MIDVGVAALHRSEVFLGNGVSEMQDVRTSTQAWLPINSGQSAVTSLATRMTDWFVSRFAFAR